MIMEFEDQGYEELLKETTATNANLDSLAAIAGESVEALFHVYMERVRILCEGDQPFSESCEVSLRQRLLLETHD